MPFIISESITNNNDIATVNLTIVAVGKTSWYRFGPGNITIQLTGPATNVSMRVERTTVNPTSTIGDAAAGPVETEAFTGNPLTGIPPAVYLETVGAWWRLNITVLTGTPLYASIGGPA